jgi:solute carrier family 25 protein 44
MSGALWVPADLVSQRLMLQGPDRSKHLYTGMTDAVRKIWRAEGARGFYVGFGASLLTHIPNSATCWAVYEYTKKQLYRHWWWPRQGIQPGQTGSERTDGSHFVNMISAVTAGVVASAVSTPFDVIRVRKQAEGLSAALYSTPAAGAAPTSAAPNQSQQTFHDARLYRGSTLSSMRTLVAEVGWTGLFRGLVPRCLAAAPQAALLLVAYDLVKNLAKIDPPNRSNVN